MFVLRQIITSGLFCGFTECVLQNPIVLYIAIYVDFSKAFDTVSHVLLIRKLQKLDIPPFVINWIINFLDGKRSFKMSITRSIVQGSGLGPFLLIIYILDQRRLYQQLI